MLGHLAGMVVEVPIRFIFQNSSLPLINSIAAKSAHEITEASVNSLIVNSLVYEFSFIEFVVGVIGDLVLSKPIISYLDLDEDNYNTWAIEGVLGMAGSTLAIAAHNRYFVHHTHHLE